MDAMHVGIGLKSANNSLATVAFEDFQSLLPNLPEALQLPVAEMFFDFVSELS
jgi:hypothetical protein